MLYIYIYVESKTLMVCFNSKARKHESVKCIFKQLKNLKKFMKTVKWPMKEILVIWYEMTSTIKHWVSN